MKFTKFTHFELEMNIIHKKSFVERKRSMFDMKTRILNQ